MMFNKSGNHHKLFAQKVRALNASELKLVGGGAGGMKDSHSSTDNESKYSC